MQCSTTCVHPCAQSSTRDLNFDGIVDELRISARMPLLPDEVVTGTSMTAFLDVTLSVRFAGRHGPCPPHSGIHTPCLPPPDCDAGPPRRPRARLSQRCRPCERTAARRRHCIQTEASRPAVAGAQQWAPAQRRLPCAETRSPMLPRDTSSPTKCARLEGPPLAQHDYPLTPHCLPRPAWPGRAPRGLLSGRGHGCTALPRSHRRSVSRTELCVRGRGVPCVQAA